MRALSRVTRLLSGQAETRTSASVSRAAVVQLLGVGMGHMPTLSRHSPATNPMPGLALGPGTKVTGRRGTDSLRSM